MVSAAMATQPQGGRVVVIDKPDAGQAAVYLARTGINRKDADFFRGIVTNSVLSGYSGRLNQEIRIKRGLSYGAGSTLDTRRDVGPFLASAQTKNESGAQVAELLLGEINRLVTAPPADVELTPRKAVLIGNFSRNLETVSGLVNQVASLALQGLSLDEINRYITNVQAITTADVQKFAGTKLDAKTSNIIIVGNAKAFMPALEKQFKNIEVIPMEQLDLNTALLRKKQP
jgi:zinc protease